MIGFEVGLGLFAIVYLVVAGRKAGFDWRPAGRVLGVAAAAFAGAIVLRSVPHSPSGALAAGIFTALGWLCVVISAMIAGQTGPEK